MPSHITPNDLKLLTMSIGLPFKKVEKSAVSCLPFDLYTIALLFFTFMVSPLFEALSASWEMISLFGGIVPRDSFLEWTNLYRPHILQILILDQLV